MPPTLLELARKKFTTLSRAEEELFRATQEGGGASTLTGDEAEDNPANAANWQAERVVRAHCITWLCTDPEASMFVTYRGLTLGGMRIDGELHLRNAQVEFSLTACKCAFSGNILLLYAQLRGLYLFDCRIKSLDADGARIVDSVHVRKVKADGRVRLVGATIGGDLDCEGAQLSNPNGEALNADGAKIGGNMSLHSGFKTEGQVRLAGATVGGSLQCSDAQLSNSKSFALVADRAKIEGSVFLCDGFNAEGEVRLLNATVGGNLNCRGAQLSNPSGKALGADGAKIAGEITLRGPFKAEGEVRMMGATLGGNLDCEGAQFSNPNGNALAAFGAKISGNIYLRNRFKAEGLVRLSGTDLGNLFVNNVVEPEKAILDLRFTKTDTLWDDERSWPLPGNLLLDGFTYERFSEESPTDAKSRIEWLHRQARDTFLPQPYQQLAAVLRKMGHERDARLIMIQKNRDRAGFNRFLRQAWWRDKIFDWLIRYGYAPWRAFGISIIIILLGWLVFYFGFSLDLVSPTRTDAYVKAPNGELVLGKSGQPAISEDYPVFNALVYSAESFIPLIKFDQSANWMPNANRSTEISMFHLHVPSGRFLRY